jgi:hypothetical protein
VTSTLTITPQTILALVSSGKSCTEGKNSWTVLPDLLDVVWNDPEIMWALLTCYIWNVICELSLIEIGTQPPEAILYSCLSCLISCIRFYARRACYYWLHVCVRRPLCTYKFLALTLMTGCSLRQSCVHMRNIVLLLAKTGYTHMLTVMLWTSAEMLDSIAHCCRMSYPTLLCTVHRSRVDPRKECESCGTARFRERK